LNFITAIVIIDLMPPTEETRHHEAVRSKQTRRNAIRHYLGYRNAVENRRLKIKTTTSDPTKVDVVKSSSSSRA
jgi:hypothetical protein